MMMQTLLAAIEGEIKGNLTQYEGSEYLHEYVHKVFGDKEIRVDKNSERADGQNAFVKDKAWYAFDANYGTSEEKAFVRMFAGRFEALDQKFKNVYLLTLLWQK